VCSIAPADVIEGANCGSHIAGPSSRSKDTEGRIKRAAGAGSHAIDSFPLPSSSQTYELLSRSSLCARRQGREGGSRSSSAPRRGTGQMAGSAAAGSRRAALSWGPVRCPMIRHRTRLAPCGWLRGTACARAGRKTVSAAQHARAPALRSVCVSKSGGGALEAPPASRAPSRQGFCSRLSLSLLSKIDVECTESANFHTDCFSQPGKRFWFVTG
jgi:hypothetical protein